MKLESINVAGAKLNQFKKKGIETVEDLLNFLPRSYKDFRKLTGIRDESQYSVILVDISTCSYYAKKPGGRVDVLTATGLEVSTGAKVKATWFNQSYRYREVNACVRRRVLICGKLKYDMDYNVYITTPEVFTMNIEDGMKLYPEYKNVPGMSVDYLTDKMALALKSGAVYSETLPKSILDKYDLASMPVAYQCIHKPKSAEEIAIGERRIKYNDLIYFGLRREWAAREAIAGSQFMIKSMSLYNKVLNSFPYSLTDDQQRVLDAMVSQVRDRRRLHTLIQGDVGSGKTICAMLMAAAFVGSGYQAVILAPTQVLAEQHYADAMKLFGENGYEVAFLGSKMKVAEKRAVLKKIKDGTVSVVIGTHAVFSNDVEYKNLAITIADEEHKFGVAQRNALVAKAAEGCHSITMSATPIPRTIAQSIYGEDIDVQVIKNKPAGRVPVKTAVTGNRQAIYKSLARQLGEGHQAYVVCPKIEKGEDNNGVRSVEETAKEYKDEFEPKGYRVEMLTGKTSEEDTSRILKEFKDGIISILVSTTVIEVGVNVPNATVIIITNAERFGLSGLHQLRGRVGRGSAPGFCVLEYINRSETATQRLKVLCNSNDGYEIAMEDLKQRGAGDLIGTQQSGDNKYVSLMLMYPDDYKIARKIAAEMLDMDFDCCDMLRELKEEITGISA